MGGFATNIIVTVSPLLIVAVALVATRVRRIASSGRSTALSWPHTTGTVLSASLQVSQQGSGRQELPLVFYAYQVNGQVFRGNRVRVGDELGRNRSAGTDNSASSTVARYPAGAPVIVYYDPTDPSCSALER